ncbi:ATPase [Dryocola sp. BD626]|uniref:ATPase n=1 Tax=Dryocola sp. BD626 TaxID=3133273 RepID=UPI003F4F8504
MSGQGKHAAEGRLNKKDGSAVIAQHESSNIYYRPDTGQLVFISGSVAGEFENHWSDLISKMNVMHQAGIEYSMAVEKYGTAYCKVSQGADVTGLENAATLAQNKLDDAKKELQKKLGEFTPKGYEQVVELIPIKTKGKGRVNGPGSRYVYVKKGYYDGLAGGKKHQINLSAKDRESAKNSVFIYDENGNRKGIDTTKLKKQISDFKLPDAKFEIFKFDKDDIGSIDKTLTGWADSWNHSLKINKENDPHIDISAGAQFMRFTANAGASGEWDAKKGNVTFKAEGEATLALAQGCANVTYYRPDRVGWPLIYKPDDTAQTINMGMLRVYFQAELIGFAGASAQIEDQLQVVTYNAKDVATMAMHPVQTVLGKREKDKSKKLPIFSQRRNLGALFHKKMDEQEQGITISNEVFGGAKAELTLKGGVQWLQPQAATEYQGKTGEEARAVSKFVDFCSIGVKISGLAGLGAGFTFYCTFLNGKFCFKIAASLCCGLGAKGAFLCEVGYEKLKTFGTWLAHQLYANNYSHLDLISTMAFNAFSRICVILLTDMKGDVEEILKSANSQVSKIYRLYDELVSTVEAGMDASKKRNELAKK